MRKRSKEDRHAKSKETYIGLRQAVRLGVRAGGAVVVELVEERDQNLRQPRRAHLDCVNEQAPRFSWSPNRQRRTNTRRKNCHLTAAAHDDVVVPDVHVAEPPGGVLVEPVRHRESRRPAAAVGVGAAVAILPRNVRRIGPAPRRGERPPGVVAAAVGPSSCRRRRHGL